MTKKLLAIVCSLFLPLLAAAQPLSAYTNVQNEVMVWDNGAIRKIDYLQPIEMKVGRIAMPYIDNSRNFKIYYRGAVRNVNIGFTNEFKVGDCLVSFLNATSLNVFDRGQITNLTRLCTNYYFGDSLIVFLDGRTQEYKSYYNGNVSTFEGFLADPQNVGVNKIEVGSNIAAYINYANQFHILYHGAVVEQEMYTVSSFKTGRNTVAYIDAGNQFKVFYDGTTQVLESFPPQSYSVGNGLVAYVTVDGNFNIFCNGKVYKMGYFRPVYQVSDFVVIYQDPSGYGKVFEDGQTTTLEPYMPEKFQAQYHSVAYFDRNNILKMYNNGEVNEVTSALTPGQDTWRLSYDVIMYQVGNNFFKFYYQGKEY